MKELLTASRMSSLLSCPRKHYLSYELGLKTNSEASYFGFGHAWHMAMEMRWQQQPIDAILTAILALTDIDQIAQTTVAALLTGYCARYKDEIVAKIHPEIEFRHAIKGSNTFDSAGKIDGLGVLVDGRQALIEHKTSGEDISPESDYWLRLRANGQVFQYVLAARALQWDVQTVIYDVVRKPAIRVKQGETIEGFGIRLAEDCSARPDFYFARREVPVLDQDLEEFQVQRVMLSRQILASRYAEKKTSRREQAWARNINAMTCRSCDYSQFCLQNISINPAQPPAGFSIGSIHAELIQPV